MRTDVMTPARPAQPGSRRGTGPGAAGGRQATPEPDARRSARPGRRPRPDRPGGPIRPAGRGRPGRTVRTVGPPRQLRADGAGQTSRSQARPAGQASATWPERARPAGRTSFIMLLLGFLGGGLTCLLVVNTTLAANPTHTNNPEH